MTVVAINALSRPCLRQPFPHFRSTPVQDVTTAASDDGSDGLVRVCRLVSVVSAMGTALSLAKAGISRGLLLLLVGLALYPTRSESGSVVETSAAQAALEEATCPESDSALLYAVVREAKTALGQGRGQEAARAGAGGRSGSIEEKVVNDDAVCLEAGIDVVSRLKGRNQMVRKCAILLPSPPSPFYGTPDFIQCPLSN